MRKLLILAALGAAMPALAQLPLSPTLAPDPGQMALQEMQRQQLVQQQNQITALEAQLRTQQALIDLQTRSISPRLPPVDTRPGRALPHIDTSRLASIPDAALAESNKRVLEAAGRR